MSLADAAFDALSNGRKVQAEVRDLLNAHSDRYALVLICDEMAEFKDRAERETTTMDESDVGQYRKQVNNIINDVSRICRQVTGKSIVCTQRKGGYKYEAKVHTPRAKSEESDAEIISVAPPAATAAPEFNPHLASSQEAADFAVNWILSNAKQTSGVLARNYPTTAITELLKELGQEGFTDCLKESAKAING